MSEIKEYITQEQENGAILCKVLLSQAPKTETDPKQSSTPYAMSTTV